MTDRPLTSHRAVIRTWPGRSFAVGEGLARLVKATRPLSGCMSIAASREPNDVRQWHLSLCWDDECAMGAWLAGPAAELFAELVARRLVMQIDFQPGDTVLPEARLRRAG
jgi:quinol monooxygenase YgiN